VIIGVIRRNPSSASNSAYMATHFSVAWSVCLSVVCHTRAPCSNRSTDFDAIWQVDLWGPIAKCQMESREGRFGGHPTVSQTMQLQTAAT